MKRTLTIAIAVALLAAGCSRKKAAESGPKATAYGTAIVVSSGDKQIGTSGAQLDQPVVVQVNDAQGNAVTGAPVWMRGADGVVFTPAMGVTDSSGQFTTAVQLGQTAGRYTITGETRDSGGKAIDIKFDEIALGYQEVHGRELNAVYCQRCHDPESTPERVSNFDNLDTKPHAFTEGDALNQMSDADLTAIITHGGAALNKSPDMPPYGYTLSKAEIQALVAYIRAVADPPYRAAGVVYAKK